MNKYISILILLLSCATLEAQTLSDENFIYTAAPQKAVKAANFNTLTKDEVIQSVTYFDGLGRPMQAVGIRAGVKSDGSVTDIITHIGYDNFGRKEKEYLPYTDGVNSGIFRTGNIDLAAKSYYAGYYPTDINATLPNPYSQKELEASPLNRVLKQAAPGYDWRLGGGNEIKLSYQTNLGNEVKNFGVSLTLADNTYMPTLTQSTVNGGFYNANELYKTVTYDENTGAAPTDETKGSKVEFKNKNGQVVLKRTYGTVGTGTSNVAYDTYYVYDIYSNLTYVIPPKADATITAAVLADLCYQYKYDQRNRLVEKKLPGKQWEFTVYDKLDRVVATGPALSPFNDTAVGAVGWMITKYDALSRPVYTGWEQSASVNSAGRVVKQTAFDIATALNESKQASGTIDGIPVYYTNILTPTSFKLLTVNYYDNYAFPGVAAVPATVETQTVLGTAGVKGLTTGSWTRVPTASTAILGEAATTFYDGKERPIRTYNANYLGGYTYTDSKLDFPGKPEYTITYHKRDSGSTELKTKEVFTYSPQGRLLSQTHQINGGSVEIIASNTYDELGQLITKKVGGNTQKVDYAYNIRGWLKGINNTSALQQGSDPIDLFAFKINYNNPTLGITDVKPLYNENVSETYWATNSDSGVIRSYGYKYDNLNRLREGVYKKGSVSGAYNENMSYDKNGNIINLTRYGSVNDNTQIVIDNLTYDYKNSGVSNQLMKVTDAVVNNSNFKDEFKDSASNTADDYSYDANGNMTKDNNKNITDIIYNQLNLPTKITFGASGNIVYIYNAAGQKLEKIVTQGTTITTSDYLGGYQYLKPHLGTWALQFFPTAEGYVEPSGGSYKYVYQYKDHLGNVRLSYDKSLVIQEENNYYPFGLKQAGYNTMSVASNYKYKYQGQEHQDEQGLNWDSFKWRNYDPAIGRFMCIDPLAEEYSFQSPYNFAENRVIEGIELEGLEIMPANQAQQWNSAFKGMIQTFAGTFDKVGANVKAFLSISRDFAPNSKVETTTTASAELNFLNFVNAKQFDQNTKVNPFIAKVETKVEVKVKIAEVKAKVEGVDVSVKATNITNVTTGSNKTEVKTVAGVGSNGVFVTNTSDNNTGQNTTRAGVQVEAETPKVQNATLKVGASFSVGQ